MPKHDKPVPEVRQFDTMIHCYSDSSGNYLITKSFSVQGYLYMLRMHKRLVVRNYKVPVEELKETGIYKTK